MQSDRVARRLPCVRWARSITVAIAALLAGCETSGPPDTRPIPGALRMIKPATDPRKTFTVHREMVFYEPFPPKRGLAFPVGVYELEAEDEQYWYFRCPHPLEVLQIEVVNHLPEVTERRRVEGGLMLEKRFAIVAGGGYIDETTFGGNAKNMIWDVSTDFRSMEGKYWTKNF